MPDYVATYQSVWLTVDVKVNIVSVVTSMVTIEHIGLCQKVWFTKIRKGDYQVKIINIKSKQNPQK